jgi:hypothetical protein
VSRARYARVWGDSLKVGDVFKKVRHVGMGCERVAWYEVTDLRELGRTSPDNVGAFDVLATWRDGDTTADDYIRHTIIHDDIITIDRGK